MSFKKIITAVITALLILVSPFTFQTAKAEELSLEEHSAVLSSGYETVLDFYNQGGVISGDNCFTLYTATSEAVKSAEAIQSIVTQEEYDKTYRDKHTDVFRVFKNTVIYQLENSYDESLYSTSGVVAINNKLAEVKGNVSVATSYQVVIDSAQVFYEFIGSDEPSKKISNLSTSDSQPITAHLSSSEPIFASDDVIESSFFIDTVIIKNTKVALMGNENLLDASSGVACFFSLRWIRNGVVLDASDVNAQPTAVAVEIADLGVELTQDSCVQIVRYAGNGEVEFIENVEIIDGYLTFLLDKRLDSDYEFDFAVVAKGYALESATVIEKFASSLGLSAICESIAESLGALNVDANFVLGAICLLIVPLALSILYFIYRLIVRAVKNSKKKKYKQFRREYGDFQKYKKRVKKEKKLAKKQKRLDRKQKRLERKLRRKNKETEEN